MNRNGVQLAMAREEERARCVAFLQNYAARLRSGPRPRASWETPINTNQFEGEDAESRAVMVEALAGSIRAGIHIEEEDDAQN